MLIAVPELREQRLSEAQIQSILLRRAHGHVCAGPASLFTAISLFAQLHPVTATKIARRARQLAAITPNYGELPRTCLRR
jgi:hypothetical protein